MIIEFRKVPATDTTFEIIKGDLKVSGTFFKINQKLVDIKMTMMGQVLVTCNRCAKEFSTSVEEEVELKVSDGVYTNTDEESNDLIYETFDSKINFDEIIDSEIEAIKLDYHFCSDCSDDDYEVEL